MARSRISKYRVPFGPLTGSYWNLGATLRLEGKSGKQPDKEKPEDMRGEAIVYLWDEVNVDDALGYHDKNYSGIPFGVVFTELSKQIGENWTVTLSHEVLELIGDPEANLLVMGPHPNPGEGNMTVFHWYEMCDAVQTQKYTIDDIQVSNFVLPLYFTGTDEFQGRNDFLGRINRGKSLTSFGISAGGYFGYFDPQKNDMDTYSIRGVQSPQVQLSRQEQWTSRLHQ